MICVPSVSPALRSKTFTGGLSPSIDQWKTLWAVTNAIQTGEIQRQNATGAVIAWFFILVRRSRLKICNCSAAAGLWDVGWIKEWMLWMRLMFFVRNSHIVGFETFQSNYLRVGVHDGGFGRDFLSRNGVASSHINRCNLRDATNGLANCDVLVGLHWACSKLHILRINRQGWIDNLIIIFIVED